MIQNRFLTLSYLLVISFLIFPNCVVAQSTAEPAEGSKLPTPSSLTEPLTEEEKTQAASLYVTPEEKVQATYAPPPNAKAIVENKVWVDLKRKRVYVDGYVTMREGPLEMFACPIGTKEHEAIIATLAKSSEVHTALLAIGTRPGTPVQFLPNFIPATGQRIRVWICYRDENKVFKFADARNWVKKSSTKKTLKTDWVFSGSGFWRDPNDGREYYRADGGDMICVSNFSTAMMDLPIASSAEANSLQFSPNTPEIPKRGTAIRMVLAPIPINAPVEQEPRQIEQQPAKPQPATLSPIEEPEQRRPAPSTTPDVDETPPKPKGSTSPDSITPESDDQSLIPLPPKQEILPNPREDIAGSRK